MEEDLARALVATGFPYDRDNVPAALELFGRLFPRAQGMRRLGAAALDLCYVAAGRLDVHYERGIHAWVVAAGALILAEAGSRTTAADLSRSTAENWSRATALCTGRSSSSRPGAAGLARERSCPGV